MAITGSALANAPSRTLGYGGTVGWTVGRFDWLNNPDSKVNRYWRVIEDGSASTHWPWVGQTIVGLWGPAAGSNERPNRLIGGDPLSAAGAGENQKFVPFTRTMESNKLKAGRAALWYFFEGGRGPNLDLLHGGSPAANRRIFFWLMTRATFEQLPFVTAVVTQPISPHRDYERAFAAFDPVAVEFEQLKIEIRKLFQADLGTSAGRQRAREQAAHESPTYAPRSGPRRQFTTDAGPYLPGSAVGITVTASAELQDFIRNGKGQFTNGTLRSILRDVNARVAKQFQDAVVAEMQRNTKRPPTGDLIRATKDPRNRYPQ